MKRVIGAGALAAGLLVTGSAGAAQNPVYFGGGVAIQSVPAYDDGLALDLKAGMKLDQVSPGFGLEGELTQSISEPEPDDFRGFGGDVAFTTLGGYATYMVPLPNRRVSLKARFGLVWERIDPERGDTDTEVGLSWGLGGEYRVNNQVSAFVEYTRIESDLSHLSGGMLVHF